MGENGAGKSTLVGVLGGFVRPDSGTVSAAGSRLPLGDPVACKRRGVAMVHQHFTLVPEFSLDENLALANLIGSPFWLDIPALCRPAMDQAAKLGWQVSGSTATRSHSLGAQQRIEIIKALAGDADVLILDEPTGVLSPGEVEELFRVLRQLKSEGRTVVLIAHKLSEVMAVADWVTVLRQGQVVAGAPVAGTSLEQVAQWMIGEPARRHVREPVPPGRVVARAAGLCVKGSRGDDAVRGASFSVRAGEVLGIGGVDGNGQVELAEAVAGVREVASGTLVIEGTVGLLPQDRQHEGLALSMSVADNLLVAARAGRNKSQADTWVRRLLAEYEVRYGKVTDPAASLSGGNQQKLVCARVLDSKPDLVVAVSPTRGLDFRATAFVRSRLLRAAELGAAVLLVSTDRDELAETADRSLFMDRGQLSDRFLEGA